MIIIFKNCEICGKLWGSSIKEAKIKPFTCRKISNEKCQNKKEDVMKE